MVNVQLFIAVANWLGLQKFAAEAVTILVIVRDTQSISLLV